MSEDEKQFLPYELARKIVGEVIEEEHLHEANRRVLTVYDLRGKELCWFDAEEIIAEVTKGAAKPARTQEQKDAVKVAAVEAILHQLPAWVIE